MRRSVPAVCIAVLLLVAGHAALASGKRVGQVRTRVAGGIITAPTGVPSGGDPSTFHFQGYCSEEWTGSWTGASVCHVTDAHFDPTHGELTATIVDTFTGIYLGDHSHGTLTISETFDGNMFSGSGVLKGDIVRSSGDPTFLCSGGHLEMPFYWNAAAGYGGYSGTWTHTCPK
jgi:hypothetical protein